MAVTAITPEVLTRNAFDTDALTMTAPTSASDGFVVPFDWADHKLLMVFWNTSADTAYDVTVKAGNALQGLGDLKAEVAAGNYALLAVESGRFKNVGGAYKGKVRVVVEDAAVKMSAVVMP